MRPRAIRPRAPRLGGLLQRAAGLRLAGARDAGEADRPAWVRALTLAPGPLRVRWAIHGLIVGTVLLMACGWGGGAVGTATPGPAATATGAPAAPSPESTATLPVPVLPPPAPSPSPSPSPAATGESYTVAEGDTLASIAERFYGDPTLWRRIYDANRAAIGDNPDSVRIGTSLRIPPRP